MYYMHLFSSSMYLYVAILLMGLSFLPQSIFQNGYSLVSLNMHQDRFKMQFKRYCGCCGD